MTRVLRWLARLDARYRIVVGLAAGMIVFFSLRDRLPISTDGMASWDTFAFFVLVLAWIVILKHRKLTCAHAPRDRT
jgi:putative intracellular protease/amidase